ncbi:NADPH:quinone oxidoreductase family protein [Bacillus cereus]|uniref:NADPH:quinone oxidoreductase family protein n=2 Tax=Bacillus cereus group TaxID=86661 RepID=A0A643M0T7_BACTU|nr:MULTISPECIES: NADPH:quinone oxidoreductase family protein [Bacillus cereus group]AHZ51011.1 quinone oxidoreductase [Bacillus thuringiensis serovar kurstaki str. YBT-1520]AIE33420.1 quinone oxidoreductase [Bacillus thuringiensis serovar kurstaki str. HD-1]AJK42209.1 zinc-binding dehydrogenase family protein [Bacillus thuringiensis serovar kurstaki]AKJ57224.1 quinone oxidoreductase [Bacillus thuringiensis]ALL59887.1 quinone oxidoreductase [Bacillus thuringiensis]
MKAIVVTSFGGPEVMKYTDLDIPAISEDQVLIRVVATSVNFADIKLRYGKKGNKALPFIPGIDATGIVERVGSHVKNIHPGQRVIAFPQNGSYAEYVVANENLTFVLPHEVDFQTAAACPIVSFTSYNLLANVARLQQGESVLIHAAAGGIGTTAIQLAKLLEAGADYVICHQDEDFVEKVNELTNGEGVDVILDSISGTVSERSLNCLAYYGRLVHFGNASGEIGNFQTKDLHASCRSILGFSFGNTRKKRPELLQETANEVFRYLRDGRLQIKATKSFPLQNAGKAHEWVESRKSTGKVILTV